MCYVDTAVPCRDLRELHNFGRTGEAIRHILQRSAQAESALFHSLSDQEFHLLHLGGRCDAVIPSDDVIADAARADERADVDGRMNALLKALEVVAQGTPVGDHVEGVEWSLSVSNTTFADHAIAERRIELPSPVISVVTPWRILLAARLSTRIELGLAEHVDESGRDHHAAGIQDALRRHIQLADGRDLAITDSDVAKVPWRSGPINDPPVSYEHIDGRIAAGRRPELGSN